LVVFNRAGNIKGNRRADKKMRLQHNLTQKEMSDEVGLSVSTISLIEQGKSTTVESLIRILMRLNRLRDFESVFSVVENQELKFKFEKAKLKSERKRASKKVVIKWPDTPPTNSKHHEKRVEQSGYDRIFQPDLVHCIGTKQTNRHYVSGKLRFFPDRRKG
jgi:transcriptional regulator with XRE-family HTH domain